MCHQHDKLLFPFSYKAPAGQKINLTLLNFARWSGTSSGGQGSMDGGVCYESATITEPGRTGTAEVLTCATDSRERSVYLSKTNKVTVTFVEQYALKSVGQSFLIKFQGLFKINFMIFI